MAKECVGPPAPDLFSGIPEGKLAEAIVGLERDVNGARAMVDCLGSLLTLAREEQRRQGKLIRRE